VTLRRFVRVHLPLTEPWFSDVETERWFGAGVEPDNVASVRALVKAGFRPLDARPDFEGMIYFVWRRSQGFFAVAR
jgi:hypothetical protein